MTSRQLYEAVIIELHKENAPNILLEDFNYFANKAINQYVNKRYNIYDINQQTTDDLRVLKATALLTVSSQNQCTQYNDLTTVDMGATYEVDLPDDYLHILNCICIYKVNKTYKCYNKDDTWRCAATRLTADAYSQVLDNFWNRPTYKRPYYYIHNVNQQVIMPTNPYKTTTGKGTDASLYSIAPTDPSDAPSGSKDDIDVPTDSGEHHDVGDMTAETTTVRLASPFDGPGTSADVNTGADVSAGTGTGASSSDLPSVDTGGGSGSGTGSGTSSGTSSGSGSQSGTSATPGTVNGGTSGTDLSHEDDSANQTQYEVYGTTELPRTIKISGRQLSTVEREAYHRYGNVTKVRMEIRYGTDNSIFELIKVYIDYIKTPQNIRLTQKQLDLTEDTSQMLEFPDYVCHEIVNELVHIIMENITDPRLQTHPVVTQSIANPAQQQTEPVAQAAS